MNTLRFCLFVFALLVLQYAHVWAGTVNPTYLGAYDYNQPITLQPNAANVIALNITATTRYRIRISNPASNHASVIMTTGDQSGPDHSANSMSTLYAPKDGVIEYCGLRVPETQVLYLYASTFPLFGRALTVKLLQGPDPAWCKNPYADPTAQATPTPTPTTYQLRAGWNSISFPRRAGFGLPDTLLSVIARLESQGAVNPMIAYLENGARWAIVTSTVGQNQTVDTSAGYLLYCSADLVFTY